MTVDVLNRYPILDPASRSNPHEVYEQMRECAPIWCAQSHHGGHRVWFFVNYADVVTVLRDQRFIKEVSRLPEEHRRKYMPDGVDPVGGPLNQHLLNLDPPRHTRMRSLVRKAFTRRRMENVIPRIGQIVDELLDTVTSDAGDLLDDFAFPLPITVIAELLGVEAERRDDFREWTRAILFGPICERVGEARIEFVRYINERIDERYKEDKDDVLSALVRVEENGERLSREELMSMSFLLLVAGYETTVNLIGNGTLALLQHPDQMRMLQDRPSLIGSAVEEMLRWNGPIETPSERWASEDVDIGGVVIRQGDVVRPSLLGANRDPTVFDEPNVLDITRDPNPHIAFGRGSHYCMGAPLARAEAAIAITALLRRFPNLQLNARVDQLEWKPSLLIHGMKAMPVRYR